MRTTTAVVRYVLSNTDVSFQYLYNQLAVSSLPTSKVPAIMATLNGIPPKNIIRPAILNQAATPAMARAVNKVSSPNHIVVLFIVYSVCLYNYLVNNIVYKYTHDPYRKFTFKCS